MGDAELKGFGGFVSAAEKGTGPIYCCFLGRSVHM